MLKNNIRMQEINKNIICLLILITCASVAGVCIMKCECLAIAAAAAQQAAAAAALAQEATQQQAVQQQPTATATNANAALLSLLNTSPVNNVNSATSAAVANAITNSNNLGSVVGVNVGVGLTNQQQQTVQTINQKMLGRKMTIANVPRVLNHGNVITVNNSNLTGNTVVSVPQQVRISALASQLASPPVNVIFATANTSQQQPQGQTQTFTLTTVGGAGFPTSLNYTTVPLHSANQLNQMKVSMSSNSQGARLMSGGVSNALGGTLRGIPSKPNGDGTGGSSSSSNNSGGGGCISSSSGLSALLVNTPAADHPMPGAANTASALLERLTASSSGTSPVPADSPTHFTVGPKVQQIPVQLAKGNQVLTPMSSPPPQQTLNVHTLNLTPFQGTLNNIQAIPNVQVQIPRLSSPSSTHPTSLIFSVAVTTGTTTCTSVSPQVNSIATSSLGSNAVVLTNNTAPGSTSPVLPLPIGNFFFIFIFFFSFFTFEQLYLLINQPLLILD